MNSLEDNLNKYINGTISFLTYRERRTQYINDFVDSGHLPDDTIPLFDAEQEKIRAALQQKIRENTPIDTSTYTIQNNMSPHSTKQYIGLGVLIIAAVFAWYYSSTLPENTSKKNDEINTPTTTQTQLENPTIAAPETKKESRPNEKKFIINFLTMDKWDSETLSEFLVKWQALSRNQKKQTKQSQSFVRLKNSLRLRILEQQALQSTKNKSAERQENLLIWFASQLSVAIS